MATTLANIKTAVIHKLGLESTDGMMDELTMSINAALQQMATEYDWPWLVTSDSFNTVAGTTSYAIPADCTRIKALGYLTDPMDRVQWEEWIRYQQTQGGEPGIYYIENSAVKIAPIPDGVYTIQRVYIQPENVLVSDGDAVKCPDWYSDIVVTYAALEEARRSPDIVSVRVNTLEALRETWLKRLADNDTRGSQLPAILTRNDW